MENIIKEKESNTVIYELSYLVLPSLAETQVPGKEEAIKELLTGLGGAIISGETPVLIDLAYPMTKVVQTVRHKIEKAYFGWVKFELATEMAERLKKALDMDPELARYLLIKTVRENTLLNGKMMLGREEKNKEDEKEESESPAKEVNSEEIDKSIDDLVIA